MCLAVPGKVVEVTNQAPPFASGVIEFAGVRRNVNLTCVPQVAPGDFVLVHAGIAIAQINAAEADRMLQELAAIGAEADLADDNQMLRADA
jgi:hydrogenase expression/formation protein HypC